MDITLDKAALSEMVAQRLLHDYDFKDMVWNRIDEKINAAIKAALGGDVQTTIKQATDKAIEDLKSIRLQKTNNWGEPFGQSVSIAEYVEEEVKGFFSDSSTIRKSASKRAAEAIEEEIRKAK